MNRRAVVAMPETNDLQLIEASVQRALRELVEDLPSALSANEDLSVAGVKSLDLIVLLSTLEREYNVVLDDIFVAKGYTIRGIAQAICSKARAGDD
jgi:acyl carrier protein